jgi:hypothetical protein
MTRSIPFLGGMRAAARSALAAALAASLAAACGGGGAGASAPAGGTTLATQTGGGGAAPAGPAAPAKPASLDTAEAVIEASLAAQGGRPQLGKVKAIRQSGTFALPQMGLQGTMMTVAAPPRNTLLVLELPGIGKMRQGVSGDIAWDLNPLTGARVISGDERAQLLREATFGGDLLWKQLYPKAELAGEAELAGTPAYKVVLTAADGDAQTRYYAKDTLLPIGVESVARTQMGKMNVVMELSDWREVGGVKYAHRLQRKEGPQTIEVTIDKIEIDPQLDPATFALPPEIAALPAAKASAAGAPAPTPKPGTKP